MPPQSFKLCFLVTSIAAISQAATAPAPKNVEKRDDQITTSVTVYDTKINWGNANPPDVLKYLTLPGGSCNYPDSCKTDGMTNLPTQIGNGSDFTQETFDIQIVDSQYNDTSVRDSMIAALQAAVSVGTDIHHVGKFASSIAPLYGSYNAPQISDCTPGVSNTIGECMQQNYQTNEMNVQRRVGGEIKDWIHVKVSLQESVGGHCKDFAPVVSGTSGAFGAFAGAFPEFAPVAGILGIISAVCSAE